MKNPPKFLKENFNQIHNAIEEVFAGTDVAEVKGNLVDFDYTEDDCSDLRPLGSTSTPRNYGPGIRVAVKFTDQKTARFFYPEKECNSIDEFLDNLNTDFGMSQIMFGKNTKSLGITYYDLTNNLIRFRVGEGDVWKEKKLFNTCWNVDTLTFDINKFLAINSAAEKEAGIGKLRGAVMLFDTPILPDSIKVLGINKENYLKVSRTNKM